MFSFFRLPSMHPNRVTPCTVAITACIIHRAIPSFNPPFSSILASTHIRKCFSSLCSNATTYSPEQQQPNLLSSSSWMTRFTREWTQHRSISVSSPPFISPPPSSTIIATENSREQERVLLLMSGGVDSSVCAYLLQQQGYHVTGLYMHNWHHEEETQDELERHEAPSSSSTQQQQQQQQSVLRTAPIRPKVCSSDRDWADVQAVCVQLRIEAIRLDFSRQYWNQVFEVMLQEYQDGQTPNPDIACNREIKFGELIDWCHHHGGLGKSRHQSQTVGSTSAVAVSSSSILTGTAAISSLSTTTTSTTTTASGGSCLLQHQQQHQQQQQKQPHQQGWDYLATGHYAGTATDPTTGKTLLTRSQDPNKDQTYYLSTLSHTVLQHVKFPLAQLTKPQVKSLAATIKAMNAITAKPESMGICFVGQRRRFGEFLKEYLEGVPGPVIVHPDDLASIKSGKSGKVLGQHKGLFQYTIGQASGVANGCEKWVVSHMDTRTNTLYVVSGTNNALLFSSRLKAKSWHWISGHAPLFLTFSPPKVALPPPPPPSLPPSLAVDSSSTTTTSLSNLSSIAAKDGPALNLSHTNTDFTTGSSLPLPWASTSSLPFMEESQADFPFLAQVRHRQIPQACALVRGDSESEYVVSFQNPQRAIAPGQQIVLYDKNICLGSGVIRL